MTSLILLLSLLHVFVGTAYFLRSGGGLVVASGAFSLASSAFLGLPGIFLSLATPQILTGYHLAASFLALTFLLSALAFCAPVVRTALNAPPDPLRALHHHTPQHRLLGSLALTFLIGAAAVSVLLGGELDIGPTHERLAFIAVVFSACYLIALRRSKQARPLSAAVFLFIASSSLYAAFHFTGEGRLVAATLGFSVLFIICFVTRRTVLKYVALIASIPVLLLFGFLRGRGGGVQAIVTEAEGLESLISPFTTLADILARVGTSPDQFRLLESFFSAVLFWIPRQLWPSKPYGLGFELTLFLEPTLAAWGHSMAGSYLTELWMAGGYIAVLTGFVMIVMALQSLDKRIIRLNQSDAAGYTDYLQLIVLAMLSSGIFTFVWVGSFTFMSRDFYRVVLTLIGWGGVSLLYRILTVTATKASPEMTD